MFSAHRKEKEKVEIIVSACPFIFHLSNKSPDFDKMAPAGT
jgi:hypothetical protein